MVLRRLGDKPSSEPVTILITMEKSLVKWAPGLGPRST